MKNHLLVQSLANSLPKGFVVDLLKETDWAYGEAHSSVIKDKRLGTAEADWLEPHLRRCLLERKFQDIAGLHGLKAAIATVKSNGYKYTELIAGRFVLTLIHTHSPSRIVRSSSFRNKDADLNRYLDQRDLFIVDEKKSADVDLNAVIYHGTDFRDPYRVGFLKIGFPAEGNLVWAHRMDAYDLLEAYPEQASKEDIALVIEWKKKSGEAAAS
jgi:hypothetical protein